MVYHISYPKLFVFTLLLLFIVPQPVEARSPNPVAAASYAVKKVVTVAVKTAVKSVNSVFRGIGSFLRGLFRPKPKPKISTLPKTIQDKMTLEAAKKGKGEIILKKLGDPKYKGMVKKQLNVKSNEQRSSTVNYIHDPKTGKLSDFKFKKHSNQIDKKRPRDEG